MYGIGARELVILAVILVLLFGAKRIPELARSIGESIRYIRNGFSDGEKNDTTDQTDK